jgi:hypothetical protein
VSCTDSDRDSLWLFAVSSGLLRVNEMMGSILGVGIGLIIVLMGGENV